MDRIRKIVQLGAVDATSREWNNNNGQAYVYFEDEAIAPVVLDQNDIYQAYESYGQQMGMPVETDEDIIRVVEAARENGVTDFCNREDELELAAFNQELEEARRRADEIAQERGVGDGTVVPIPVPTGATEGEATPEEENDEEVDYSEELEEAVAAKNNTGKRVITGILAAALGFGAGFTVSQMLQNEKNQDVDNDLNHDIDFNTATFDELMASMEDDDVRKIASQQAMDLVTTFHDATHKDGNFRLEADGESYLDLSFEEALVLTAFSNYSEPEQLYEIFGTYDITSTEAQDILESARTKLITYYMNAIEPSGLAEMFASEEDRLFFQNFESTVVNFNAMHSTETSDQVIRDVYYNYILDGATNHTNVGSMAKLLAFDTVYGGLNLTESASVEHTQFLEFHGMGTEAETRYYIENVLHLDYESLSEEEIATYRTNIIESGTELVSLLPSGETKTEDNTAKDELAAGTSITNLVDKMGLCNSVNSEITEKVQALDTMEATQASAIGAQITVVNQSVSQALREAGQDGLADKVDANLGNTLSDQLLSEIRAASGDAADAVENYEGKMAALNGANRPSMEQIIGAANRQTALMENYAGSIKDVATLINNRRHVELQHSFEADENGYIGEDENGIPIYDSSVFDDMTQEEIDDFIKENGEVIDEKTEEKTEEVKEEDLTEEEKEEVEEQKAVIEAEISLGNAAENGKKGGNAYANSGAYNFSPSTVTNEVNGEVYDLNGMSFANGVAYAYAFGGTTVSAEDSQIKNAAEVAAEEYANSFTAEQREAIANGLGTSWENAKEQIKESYVSGYIGQMKVEISTALSVGQEMKDATEAAKKEVEELNKQQEQENQNENDNTQPAPEDNTNPAPEENTQGGDDSTEGVTEGEEEVVEENENDNTQPAPGEGTNPAPDEDEYDPNIGEQFQEGEILIEDAQGNVVNDFSANEDTTEVTNAAAEETATVAAPEANATQETAVVVEQPAAVVEETTVEVAPAPVAEETTTTTTTTADFTEDQIAALVEEVYQNTLIQEGEAELEETSGKRR